MGWWDLAEVFGEKGVTVGYLLIDVIPFLVPGVVVIVCTGVVLVSWERINYVVSKLRKFVCY